MQKSPQLFDISVPIFPGMPIYPGDPAVVFEPALDISCGDPANVTQLHLGSQTGTHFDTPHHILNNGKTVESLSLDACYGPARVIEIPPEIQAITAEVLQRYDLTGVTRLLLKTKNSGFWQTHPETFRTDFAALTEDGAQYAVSLGLRLIAIDYLSIELYDSPDLKAHQVLLTHDMIILEGINLASVKPGDYLLMAFPIKYQGLDGTPCRAVLVEPLTGFGYNSP